MDEKKTDIIRPKTWATNKPGAFEREETSEKLLSLDEFAAFMGAGRSTVYDWINEGFLLPGFHFFKIKRTIRFPSGLMLLEVLRDITERTIAREEESQRIRSRSEDSESDSLPYGNINIDIGIDDSVAKDQEVEYVQPSYAG